MKGYVWSIKLAAAMALLVASVALAAPDANKMSEDTGQPEAEGQWIIHSPDGDQVIRIPPGGFKVEQEVEVHPLLPNSGNLGMALLASPEQLRPPVPEYWIGVNCAPMPAVLYQHLDIPRSQGVLVVEVVPGAPAAKAGIGVHDILLAANQKPIRERADVSRIVEEAKGKPVAFELIRKGKRETVEVTPEKNPHWNPPRAEPSRPGAMSPPYAELDRIYQWFDHRYPGMRPRMRLQFMHPGVLLPPGASLYPALPGGMSITIAKQGDQPARITVTRGKETWNVDEKSVEELPKDVRPHVERMLRGLVTGPEVMLPRRDYLPRKLGEPSEMAPSLRDRIEEQMDRMDRRLEEMQKRIEGLRNPTGPEEKK